ncbi:MAG: hypothetical protein D6688_01875 [Alphaproteobacteria bacterium]|nr:MAG: hypothetical protein D6688_01875 [Alphaproteobacteria bacterium]
MAQASGQARIEGKDRSRRAPVAPLAACILAAAIASLLFSAGTARAQEGRRFVLCAPSALAESGFLKYVVPRFALKMGRRAELIVDAPAALLPRIRAFEPDVCLLPEGEVAEEVISSGLGTDRRRVFHIETEDGEPVANYLVVLIGPEGRQDARADNARLFIDWLSSDIGRRTIEAFKPADGARYVPGAAVIAPRAVAERPGDPARGMEIAHRVCGRCHVVSERNKFGGIGSTPSFAALRTIPDWEERMRTFFARNPHPSFVQIEGITEEFEIDRPPHVHPVEITEDELNDIIAYVASIEPKDLGAALQIR